MHIKEATKTLRGLKGADLVEVVQAVRAKVGKEQKLAIFLDNATIHKANIVKEAAEQAEIKLVYNLPYCPHLMGIESLWKQVKTAYRGRVAYLRVNKQDYSNLEEVTGLLDDVTTR